MANYRIIEVSPFWLLGVLSKNIAFTFEKLSQTIGVLNQISDSISLSLV